MPRPRFQNLPPDRRDQMLEVAAKEFAVHGYDGASLNHILETAGVSKGAAYYYFDDKADLFATVVRHYWDHLLGHADYDLEKLDRRSFWPALEALYRAGITHLSEAPWMLGVARSVWRLSREARGQRTLREVFEAGEGFLTSFVERGRRVGAIRDDLPTDLLVRVIVALDAAWDQWFLERADRLRPRDLEAIASKLVSAVRRMLEPPRGGRA